MEKVVLFSSDLKLSDLVCVRYLGREGTEVVYRLCSVVPLGVSCREGKTILMRDEECDAHLKTPSTSSQSIWLPLLFPLTGKSLKLLKAWELWLK